MRKGRNTESSEADYRTASSADLSDRGMLFIIQVLALSLHYIISVFWAVRVWCGGQGLGVGAVTLFGFKKIFDIY